MAYRSPYPDITVPDLNLTEQVFINAASKPDAIAMADGVTGRTISYGTLLEQIRRTASGLAARGIKKGDVVSLWSPNVPEWPIVFFAVVKIGEIVHTSNPVSTPDELAFQLKDGNVKMLFTIGGSLTPDTAFEWFGIVFAVVILGGIGNVVGTLLAGALVGAVAGVVTVAWSPATAPLVVFSLVVLALLFRPRGLLPRRGAG